MAKVPWQPSLPPFRTFKKVTFTNALKVGQFIYQVGESPILRQPSTPVDIESIPSPDFRKKCLSKNLFTQVSKNYRVWAGNYCYKYSEIYMSANPIIAPTVRPAWIEFEYYDEEGRLQKWETKDATEIGKMMNRVFQHEIDH